MLAEIRRGLIWLGSAAVGARLVDLIGSLVVVRLLSQEQIGLAALSWSVAVVLEAVSALGVHVAATQAPTLSVDQRHSLHWFSLAIAIALMGLAAACAPIVARLYQDTRLQPMVMSTAVKLLFVGLTVMQMQELARSLRFSHLSLLQLFSTGSETATKIALAYAGFGAWAIVIAFNARGLYTFLALAVVVPLHPKLRLVRSEVAHFLPFGLRFTAANVINHTARNIDYFIVGRMLGLNQLGTYRVAFDVAMAPVEGVIDLAKRVAFPVMSRVASNPEASVDGFVHLTRIVLLINGPIAVITFFLADLLLVTVVGERWLPAAPVVRALCCAAVLRGLVQIVPDFFDALGRPQFSLVNSLATIVLLSVTISASVRFFGQTYGLAVVGAGWAVTFAGLLLLLLSLFKRLVPLRRRDYARQIIPILIALAMMVLVLWGTNQALAGVEAIAPNLARIVSAAAGLLVYVVLARYGLGLRVQT